mgnify:CR=1 FL=1
MTQILNLIGFKVKLAAFFDYIGDGDEFYLFLVLFIGGLPAEVAAIGRGVDELVAGGAGVFYHQVPFL